MTISRSNCLLFLNFDSVKPTPIDTKTAIFFSTLPLVFYKNQFSLNPNIKLKLRLFSLNKNKLGVRLIIFKSIREFQEDSSCAL